MSIVDNIYNPERECMSKEDRAKLQGEFLKKTVERVYNNVPVFRERMDAKGVKPEDITSKKRNSEFVQPRQVVMYLCRKLTDTSQVNISKILGKKDHTTVIYGVKKIEEELETNEELRNKIDIIIKKLNPS